jgi:hypothetical protein
VRVPQALAARALGEKFGGGGGSPKLRSIDAVMTGLVPVIHAVMEGDAKKRTRKGLACPASALRRPGVDARDKRGHDGVEFGTSCVYPCGTKAPGGIMPCT